MNRPELVEAMSRQMASREWEEYDQGKGICTYQAGWRISETLDYAKQALIYLRDSGLLTEEAMAILKDDGPQENS